MKIDYSNKEPIAPSESKFSPIPPGVYRACVFGAENATSKTGKAMVVVEFVVSEGDHQGKRQKYWFVVETEKGQGVFLHFLKALTEAKISGFDTKTDLPKIHGRELLIRTDIEVKGGFKNCVIQDFYLIKDSERAFADFGASANDAQTSYDDVPF